MSLESFRHSDRYKSQRLRIPLEVSSRWLVYVYRLSAGTADHLCSNGRLDQLEFLQRTPAVAPMLIFLICGKTLKLVLEWLVVIEISNSGNRHASLLLWVYSYLSCLLARFHVTTCHIKCLFTIATRVCSQG